MVMQELVTGRQPENIKPRVKTRLSQGKQWVTDRLSLLNRNRGANEGSPNPQDAHLSEYNSVIDKPNPETKERKFTVDTVRKFTFNDSEDVLRLFDNEALGHLDPAPRIPNWDNQKDVMNARVEFYHYGINYPEHGGKFIPTVALNPDGKIMAFAGIRLRGDPYVPAGRRIASMERLVVGADYREHDVATVFVTSIAEEMFSHGHYGPNKEFPAVELRAWTMEDEKAGDWRKNHDFMKKLGFQPIPHANWPDYKRKRNLPDDGRGNATWWKLKPDWLGLKEQMDHTIYPTDKINL